MAANDPSGPIMFLEDVIAEALGLQRTVAKQDANGNYWLSGGCTPQTAGAKLNLREVAEAVFDALPVIREPVITKVTAEPETFECPRGDTQCSCSYPC